MIVVNESNIGQTIHFIPRYGVPATLELTGENTNVTQVVTGTFVYGDYTWQLITQFPTKENQFYWAVFKDAFGNILLKERMFCTNQPIDTFSVNDGQYISNQTTNDFIMYE
jgi:tetrahydromethanopterin S-methyltransferase subunit D